MFGIQNAKSVNNCKMQILHACEARIYICTFTSNRAPFFGSTSGHLKPFRRLVRANVLILLMETRDQVEKILFLIRKMHTNNNNNMTANMHRSPPKKKLIK